MESEFPRSGDGLDTLRVMQLEVRAISATERLCEQIGTKWCKDGRQAADDMRFVAYAEAAASAAMGVAADRPRDDIVRNTSARTPAPRPTPPHATTDWISELNDKLSASKGSNCEQSVARGDTAEHGGVLAVQTIH